MTTKTLIEIKNVTKYFGKIRILDNVSFKIPDRSVVGILGPNGSGKSTLMRIISGLIKSWEGDILFNGRSIKEDNSYLSKVGFLIEEPAFYEHLSAVQNLTILSRLTNSPTNKIVDILKKVELDDFSNKIVNEFSYGMKQRLGIAQAILNDPNILFLDEPSNGLDPIGMVEMNKIIRKLNAQGKTICISTHVLEHVKDLCSHVIILKEGRLVLNDSIENLFSSTTKYEIKSTNIKSLKTNLSNLTDLNIIDETDRTLIIDSKLSFHELIKTLPENINIHSINKEPNIQDLFL